ncbi:unnamed protein product [Psylliodes chrysocephalus]|uniref:Uncharacterized protein n=1 Tax=Psylliodes chrysocephalus TaxID=3402493 RepID=A0A9P0GCB2_9CUCU|nr:unnamed protein product [Psylliodes chrysocephala]
MPKHSRKRRRSRSRSRSRDRWLEKKLSNMQKQLDKMQKDAQNSVNNDSDNNNNSVGPFTQVSEGEEVPLVRLDSDSEQNQIEQENIASDSKEADSPDNKLGEDLLEILGSEPIQTSCFGPPVNRAIETRWAELIKKGLNDDTKKEVLNKYHLPENLILLKAPELNPEIKAAISSQILKRDDRLALKQQQLGTSISVIAEALSLSLAEEEGATISVSNY